MLAEELHKVVVAAVLPLVTTNTQSLVELLLLPVSEPALPLRFCFLRLARGAVPTSDSLKPDLTP